MVNILFPQSPQSQKSEMSSSSSPQRSRAGTTSTSSNNNNNNNNNIINERPRSFDSKARVKCWANAEIVPGRHPERWRKDAAGNIVCKRFRNCQGCLCFEYDHIVPYSKGGASTADNCQILQTRVNRYKSAKEDVDTTRLKGYSCDINFTDKELDIIEMAVYGDVIRPGNQCRCRTVAEMLGQYKAKDRTAACKLPYNDESSSKHYNVQGPF